MGNGQRATRRGPGRTCARINAERRLQDIMPMAARSPGNARGRGHRPDEQLAEDSKSCPMQPSELAHPRYRKFRSRSPRLTHRQKSWVAALGFFPTYSAISFQSWPASHMPIILSM